MLNSVGGYVHPDTVQRQKEEAEAREMERRRVAYHEKSGWADVSGRDLKGLPGIPGGLTPALGRFVNDSLDAARTELRRGVEVGSLSEVCGAFVVWPKSWSLGAGWAGEVRWLPLPNTSAVAGTFSAGTRGLIRFTGEALEQRHKIVSEMVGLSDWRGKRWTVVEEARMSAMELGLGERTGYMDEAARRIRATGLDTGSKALTAEEYLMLTGPAVLSGFGHSHPNMAERSGPNAGRDGGGRDGLDASPEDLLHVKTLEQWRRGMSYTGRSVRSDGGSIGFWEREGYMGLPGDGRSDRRVSGSRHGLAAERKPGLEKSMNAGNWICGVRNGHWAGLSRYSSHGMVAKWGK